MFALTLRQPWASAIVELGKDVENRKWSTPYRGLIAIHAGLSIDDDAMDELGDKLSDRLPSGGVIAVARLSSIVRDSPSRWARAGHFHWCIEEVQPLPKLVHCRGKQGLFRLPEAVAHKVNGAY